MMEHRKFKGVALLITVCMVFQLISGKVYAISDPINSINYMDGENAPQTSVTGSAIDYSVTGSAIVTYYIGGDEASDLNNGTNSSTPLETLQQALTLNSGGDCSIILQGDVYVEEPLETTGNISLVTDGHAHTIYSRVSNFVDFISVKSGTLNLGDIKNTQSDKLIFRTGEGYDIRGNLIDVGEKGTLNMYAETTINGCQSYYAVITNSGTFNLLGGNITGSHSLGDCMIRNSGILNMSAGNITGNKSAYAGIVNNSGIMNMSGGIISDNTGVGLRNYKSCNISGGTFENNTGGEISNIESIYKQLLSLSGDVSIAYSKSEPFSIQLESCTFVITISDNITEGNKFYINEESGYEGKPVLKGATSLVQANYQRFTLITPDSMYNINSDGTMNYTGTDLDLYVGGVNASDDNTGLDTEHPLETLNKAMQLIGNGVGVVNIQSDIALTGGFDNEGKVTIVSDGTKRTISKSDEYEGNQMIHNDGNLILGKDDNKGDDSNPTLIFDGNQIIGAAPLLYNDGVTNLYAGTSIENNYSILNAAGGVINDGLFLLHGGLIRENTGYIAGGIYCSGSSDFIMDGGTISDNKGLIGGVDIESGSNLTINDGSIINNMSTNLNKFIFSAGAVAQKLESSFTMNQCTIAGNSGFYAGVYIEGVNPWGDNESGGEYNSKPLSDFNGGSISNNNGVYNGMFINGETELHLSGNITIAGGDRLTLIHFNGCSQILIDGALTGIAPIATLECAGIDNGVNVIDQYTVGEKVLFATSNYNFTAQDASKFIFKNSDYSLDADGYVTSTLKSNWVTITGDSNLIANGSQHTVTVVVNDGKKDLVLGTDYSISYSNNINAGTATVTIMGKGSYGGVVNKNYTISSVQAPISTPTPIQAQGSIPTTTSNLTILELNVSAPATVGTDGSNTISITKKDLQTQIETTGADEVRFNVEDKEDKALILKKELLETVKSEDATLSVAIKDEKGKERYSWKFNKEDFSSSENNMADINLHLDVRTIENSSNLPKFAEGTTGLVVNFSQEGTLPAQATIRIYVGDQKGVKPGDKIYLYHLNPLTNKLDTLPYSDNYVVDADGYISFEIVHCSDYVVLTAAADASMITSLKDQIVITVDKAVLYSAVRKNNRSKINVNLPATLEVVATLADKTSQTAIGGVTIAYHSSNKKVATVDKKGAITAIGAGKAVIGTTVTLYNGKKKYIETTITVVAPKITVTKGTSLMKIGDTYDFNAEVGNSDDTKIVYSTAKKSIVAIDKKTGKAKAVSKGMDYVIVTVNNTTIKIKVVVR